MPEPPIFQRNDVLMPHGSARFINKAVGLDAVMEISRDMYCTRDEIKRGERIDQLRAVPPSERGWRYKAEVSDIVAECIALSDPTWTPEMVGKLWTEAEWIILNFLERPIQQSEPSETGSGETTASPSGASVVIEPVKKTERQKAAA